MCSNSEVDLAATREICLRLFDYRRRQNWPPKIVRGSTWDTLYADAGRGLAVLETVDEAVAWANGLIERIDAAN